jgi:threonine dehydrogenase-like Zn-dependent dehydrogenase
MREEYVPLRHPEAEVDFPLALSQHGVGRVVETGSAVEAFETGEFVQAGLDYATETVLDVEADAPRVVPAPDEGYVFMTQGGVALNAVRRADLSLGDGVVVVGAGPVGLAVTRMADLAGAHRIVVNDVYENRLALAEEFGATHTTTATRESLVEEVLPLFGEKPPTDERDETAGGPDVVFDCAGVSDAVWAGLKLVRYNGTVCVAAMHGDPLEGITLGSDFHLREVDIVSAQQWGGQNEWPWARERNRSFYLDLVADGKVGFDRMVTDRVAFEDLPDAGLFERLRDRPEESVYGVVTV